MFTGKCNFCFGVKTFKTLIIQGIITGACLQLHIVITCLMRGNGGLGIQNIAEVLILPFVCHSLYEKNDNF